MCTNARMYVAIAGVTCQPSTKSSGHLEGARALHYEAGTRNFDMHLRELSGLQLDTALKGMRLVIYGNDGTTFV